MTNLGVKISGYIIVRNDRHGNGGGSAMYIRNYIIFTNRGKI